MLSEIVALTLRALAYCCMSFYCREDDMQKYWTRFWHRRYGNCYTFNKGMDATGTHVNVMNTSQPGFGNYFFFPFGSCCFELKDYFIDGICLEIVLEH